MHIFKSFGNSKKAIVATLAISSAIAGISFPASADDAVIQETNQESYITGSGNTTVQRSNQVNRQYRNDRDHSWGQEANNNTGIVQRNQQYCDVYGEVNNCIQDTSQENVHRTRQIRH